MTDPLLERRASIAESDPRHEDLWAFLLDEGGDRVAYRFEDDLGLLLRAGDICDYDDLVMEPGAPSRCHENVWHLEDAEVWTGWALSRDRIWRQHSWGMRGLDLVETTVDRLLYFGVQIGHT